MKKKLWENWRHFLFESDDVAHIWINWIKNFPQNIERPTGYKRKQDKGTTCCWCGRNTFTGVEHIIPRGAGAPSQETWNLAWACYPCNQRRGSLIGSAPQVYKEEPTGWLWKEFLKHPSIPTKEQLLIYFKNNKI